MGISKVLSSKELEGLAVSFADEVLRRRKWTPVNSVKLEGHDKATLSEIGRVMEEYFKDREADIPVSLERGCYSINVGYFIRN